MPTKPLRKVKLHGHFQVTANCINHIAQNIFFFLLRLYFRAADQTAAGLMAEFSFPGSF